MFSKRHIKEIIYDKSVIKHKSYYVVAGTLHSSSLGSKLEIIILQRVKKIIPEVTLSEKYYVCAEDLNFFTEMNKSLGGKIYLANKVPKGGPGSDSDFYINMIPTKIASGYNED
ncbi:MAG: hypothetical protein WCQ32_03185 [bacterium]